MAPSSRRLLSLAALAVGLFLWFGHAAYVLATPSGPFEFGYAPFTPEPLPYSPMRGFTHEQLWGHVARLLLATPALLLVSFALRELRPLRALPATRKLAVAAGVLSVSVTALVMLGVLRGRALYDDELVYAMQATFYSEGRLGDSDLGFLPDDYFSIATRAGYTGKYLPLTGLLQIPGLLAGLPALLNVPLLALSLIAWHRLISLRSGPRIADFATAFLAISPMLMLTGATGLSQTPTLFCLVAAGLGLELARSGRYQRGAALAAVALSIGFFGRPQTIVPAGAVIALALGTSLVRARRLGALASFAGLGLGGVALAGLYNAALSGSPLTMPWYLQCSIEEFGFGRVWKLDTYEHTPLRALENLGVVVTRLNAWWLGFPCSLLVLAAWLLTGRKTHGSGVWLWVGLAVIAFEFFYYSPGVSDTGSAYHHELVLPGSLIAAAALDAWLARAPALAATTLAVHFTLGTVPFVTENVARLTRLVEAIHADSDRALARVEPPALLFYETRASERRSAGWVLDPFPRRYRGRSDPIVTFGNVPAPLRERIARSYPERHCYYYRRDPTTATAELHRCEAARPLMDSMGRDEFAVPLWVPPTAYLKTDYDPFAANSARRVRTPSGRPRVLCCSIRNSLARGGSHDPDAVATCVEDGP